MSAAVRIHHLRPARMANQNSPADRRAWLFQVPGKPLRSLLDHAAQTGKEFSEEEAAADLMLAQDRGDVKPQRYLAKRWKWSQSTVNRRLPDLREAVADWRSFYSASADSVNHAESQVNHRESKGGDSSASGEVVNRKRVNENRERVSIDQTQTSDPEGGEAAPAPVSRGGAFDHVAVAAYERLVGRQLPLFDAQRVAAAVPPNEVPRWEALVQTWIDTPQWNARSVAKMVSAFRKEIAEEAMPQSDRRSGGGSLDLAQPILGAEVAAAIAAHPTLSRADFRDHGSDPKTGAPLVRLSLPKRRLLGLA